MYNMINVTNTAEYVKVVKMVNFKSSHYKENFFLFCIKWDNELALSLLW